MRVKAIKDLVPGDQIIVAQPAGRARVLGVAQTVQTKVRRHGAGPGEAEAFACVVDFEFRDGASEGRRDYVFVHPDDKVKLAL